MAHWQSPPPDDATTTSKGGWLRDALKNHPDCQSFRRLCRHWDMVRVLPDYLISFLKHTLSSTKSSFRPVILKPTSPPELIALEK